MKASTPIDIDRLEYELCYHPSRVFVDNLVQGLRHGFDTGIGNTPDTTFVCKNLQTARKEPKVVSELHTKEVEKGYLLGPFDHPPLTLIASARSE
jgi:hypothetical protein